MHELKKDLGSALDGMHNEFRSIRNDLDATCAMASIDGIDTAEQKMSSSNRKHQNLDITSQLNAVQIRLKEFEEQLMKVKGEKTVSERTN